MRDREFVQKGSHDKGEDNGGPIRPTSVQASVTQRSITDSVPSLREELQGAGLPRTIRET